MAKKKTTDEQIDQRSTEYWQGWIDCLEELRSGRYRDSFLQGLCEMEDKGKAGLRASASADTPWEDAPDPAETSAEISTDDGDPEPTDRGKKLW